jgi:subtilisin family serine protease
MYRFVGDSSYGAGAIGSIGSSSGDAGSAWGTWGARQRYERPAQRCYVSRSTTSSRLAVVVVAAATLTQLAGLPAASAAARAIPRMHQTALHNAPARHRIDTNLHGAHGQVQVMLQMSDPAAVRSFAATKSAGHTAAESAAETETSRVKSQQSSVASHFSDAATKATQIYRAHAVYNGIAVVTDASRLKALAALPGVEAIHKLVPKKATNAATVPLIGAPAVWTNTGNIGTGEKIGIIDTGIDYTHADFGGPGTVAAYNAAKATDTVAPTYPDPAKVAGGMDFAGDAYDPSSTTGAQIPHPDPNPLDCNSHGTHVSGTAAGLGVLKNGSTFTGSYANIDESNFHIGPGVAPGATLFGIKVFGCAGATLLVTKALDWAADPNGDGNLSDHMDVVNLSLGSNFAAADDPDAVALNNISLAGVTAAVAAGNAGDAQDVTGSPGDATRAITVAASDDTQEIDDGLIVDSPPALAANSPYPAEESVAYDFATKPGVTNTALALINSDWSFANLATTNADGCDPLTPTQAAKVTGKVAFLEWSDDGSKRRCGSAVRTANVKVAGAVGAVFGDDTNEFTAGITGDPGIPAELLAQSAATAIKTDLDASTAVNVTLNNANHNKVLNSHPETADTVASFTSRGDDQASGVKPDVTAPGVTVFSAGMGTGTDGLTDSGTSMATPHIAGTAALVLKAHPTWTPEQVKAAIMNTAGQDLFTGTNHTGDKFAPERVGAGRVQADRAVATDVLAYNDTIGGSVSVSFGDVDAVATTTLHRTFTVHNTATSGATDTYSTGYDAIDALPGATYSVSPSSVSVAPGASQQVTVTLTVDPTALTDTPDPTMDPDPAAVGLERDFISDASGRVILTATGSTAGGNLRVPVYAAPRPASAMTQAASLHLAGPAARRTGTLNLTGTGVLPAGPPAGNDSLYLSTVDALELQRQSGALHACSGGATTHCLPFPSEAKADLKEVGVTSDAPAYTKAGLDPFAANADGAGNSAQLTFGLGTFGQINSPSTSQFQVLLDTNGDGTPDAAIFDTPLDVGGVPTSPADEFVAETDALNPDGSSAGIIDEELLNGIDGEVDTNTFNNNLLTMSVSLAALKDAGLITPATSTRIKYWVDAFGETGFIDSVGDPTATPAQKPLSVDVAVPEINATSSDSNNCVIGPVAASCSTLIVDAPGTSLSVVDTAASGADNALGLLLLHRYNVPGQRDQVVKVLNTTTTSLKLGSHSTHFGRHVSSTVTVSPSSASGTVTVKSGSRTVGTGTLKAGKATVKLSHLQLGRDSLVATYPGDATHLGSKSAAVKLTVTKATTATRVSGPSKVKAGKKTTFTAKTRFTHGRATLSGKVVFLLDGQKFATVKEKHSGRIHVHLHLSMGKHTVTAKYEGNKHVAGSSGHHSVKAS